jgi:endo-1,4-beta-xylanase
MMGRRAPSVAIAGWFAWAAISASAAFAADKLVPSASASASASPSPSPSPLSSPPAPAPSPPAPVVVLWPAGAPGSEAKRNLPETPVGGNLAGIHNPSLTVFLPEAGHATGSAVVILPGGGHRLLVVEKEGFTVARWLAAHGIAAFVLKYRLAREAGSTYRVDVESLQDVQRALRVVRSRAGAWGIDAARVGVMGFSAGGELAALSAMRFDPGAPGSADPIERQSARPAFQALIYPGGSQNIAPPKDAPPAFLVSGVDDRPDIAEGVARAYLAFRAAGVPVELHVYAGVGHGFALRPGPASSWIVRFADWLVERTAPLAAKP